MESENIILVIQGDTSPDHTVAQGRGHEPYKLNSESNPWSATNVRRIEINIISLVK